MGQQQIHVMGNERAVSIVKMSDPPTAQDGHANGNNPIERHLAMDQEHEDQTKKEKIIAQIGRVDEHLPDNAFIIRAVINPFE